MEFCPFCNNTIKESDNFCKFCGSNVRVVHNNSNNKTAPADLAVVFTIIYLGVYFVNCCIWGWFSALGDGLSVGGSDNSFLKDLVAISLPSMFFAFGPWILATIFSFLSKKQLLIIFNILIMLVNIFFLFIEKFL